jgi:hypothetical protein
VGFFSGMEKKPFYIFALPARGALAPQNQSEVKQKNAK